MRNRYFAAGGKAFAVVLAALLTAALALPAVCFGDALDPADIEIETDFYVVVNADDGGVNFREGPGVEYGKLRDEMIPNGTILHIDRMRYGESNISWGRTEFEEKTGWVALTEVVEIDEPPIEPSYPPGPEYNIGGLVLPEDIAAYFVRVAEPDGVELRYGPGEEYDEVIDETVPYGADLFIGGEALDSEGELWGFAYYENGLGWIRLSGTEESSLNPGGWQGGNSEKTKLHKHTDKGLPVGRPETVRAAILAIVVSAVTIPVVIVLIVLIVLKRRKNQ